MRVRFIPCLLVLVGCCVSSIKSELRHDEEARPMNNMLEQQQDNTANLLAKRAYYYATSGPGKRLPNYDFGLGKRSKPIHKFMFPKRADDSMEDYENYEVVPLRYAYLDEQYENIKRAKPSYPKYEFGLGKREGKVQQQRRSSNSRYDFGLGKRR